ncbi:MAG: hypothetical protein JXB15_07285 [Anaerolineales bacterium]|nr:hypothetical protein [Anaerolineales bacterium]
MLIQSQNLSTRTNATAHMAQTMSLLEMTAVELLQKIEAALSSNPALELIEEPRCPHCHRLLPASGPCPICSAPPNPQTDEPIVFLSPRRDFAVGGSRLPENDTPPEEWTAEAEDLSSYVLRQIAPELEQADRHLAAHILTSLDEDGLLRIPLIEIARYHHVPLARLEKVLHLIQRADPIGVGCATPQEALLVQLELLAETRRVPELAAQAIRQGMNLLSRRAYSDLAHLLQVTTGEARRIVNFISENLNPYPARAHWGETNQDYRSTDIYYNADIIVTRLNDKQESPLVVEVIAPYAGSLRVNPLFREALHQAPVDKTSQWQSDLEGATLLVKCLQQRNHTLVRLMRRLMTLQRSFILEGDAHLYPATRAQLAQELGVHESTVSRAVAGKTVELPNKRIVPLARMFDRSLHIRTVLMQLIAAEEKPLSDAQLAKMLMAQGYDVARRTVAKYRAMEGILPARLRKPHAKSEPLARPRKARPESKKPAFSRIPLSESQPQRSSA